MLSLILMLIGNQDNHYKFKYDPTALFQLVSKILWCQITSVDAVSYECKLCVKQIQGCNSTAVTQLIMVVLQDYSGLSFGASADSLIRLASVSNHFTCNLLTAITCTYTLSGIVCDRANIDLLHWPHPLWLEMCTGWKFSVRSSPAHNFQAILWPGPALSQLRPGLARSPATTAQTPE